jgi:hypothetical protein
MPGPSNDLVLYFLRLVKFLFYGVRSTVIAPRLVQRTERDR